MAKIFEYLRVEPWEPRFQWLPSVHQTADQINVWHEDYPSRVEATERALTNLLQSATWRPSSWAAPSGIRLCGLHRTMFRGEPWAGKYRRVNVFVGSHHAPDWDIVPKLMAELVIASPQQRDGWTLDLLEDWYHDVETLHPFEDGNGRVGGVFVAAVSHGLHPDRGYLAALQ